MNIIIGLGIAGLSFLYSKLKFSDENVTIITDDNNYGKRILVSGNGRCNISNVEVFKPNDNIHYRSHDGFIKNFFTLSDEELFLSFLEDINLRLTCEEGRYYPFSLTATSFERNLKKFVFDNKYKKRITIIHAKVKKLIIERKLFLPIMKVLNMINFLFRVAALVMIEVKRHFYQILKDIILLNRL